MPEEKSQQISLRDLGIDASAQVYRLSTGPRLLITKPSGQEWIDLGYHDFLEAETCPKCGSTETEPTFDSRYYCHNCQTLFK